MAKQRLLGAAFVLTACGVLCKALGAIYRVPLTTMLGSQGMGIYYLVFPIYSFMLALSSSSLPGCLSKLVADSLSENKPHIAKLYFRCSVRLFSIIGIGACLVVVLLSPIISYVQGNLNNICSYLVIAPAVFFVCLISCFRGYFQGYQNMTFSGISQIIEQVVKVIFGLVLAKVLLPYGLQYGVLGSLFAITISEVIATGYLYISYLVFKKKAVYTSCDTICEKPLIKTCYKTLIKTVIPFTLGYIIFPLASLFDSIFAVRLLSFAGISSSVGTSVFGLQNAVVGTLTNLPIVVSTSLAMVILPSISHLIKRNQKSACESRILLIFKVAILVVLPCVVMFIFFPKEIIFSLFGGLNREVFDEMFVAQTMLKISSVGVLFLTIFQLSTAVLQGQGKEYIPVKSLVLGVFIKVILSVVLLVIPGVNFYAINISNLVCYVVIAMKNMASLQRDFDLKINYYTYLFAPVFAVIIMALVTACVMWIFEGLIAAGALYFIAIMCGGIAYIFALFLFKSFTKNELKQIFKT